MTVAEFGWLGNLDTDLASYLYAHYNKGSTTSWSVPFYSKHNTVYISIQVAYSIYGIYNSTSSSKCLVLCSSIKSEFPIKIQITNLRADVEFGSLDLIQVFVVLWSSASLSFTI